ncbi:acyl carrier protein [Streptomyces sp. NPDC003006]
MVCAAAYTLGGGSLLAAELRLAVDQELGVEVPAAALFLTPTVAVLADAVEAVALRCPRGPRARGGPLPRSSVGFARG